MAAVRAGGDIGTITLVFWIASYAELSSGRYLSIAAYAVQLAAPALLYFAATRVFPPPEGQEGLDVAAHVAANARDVNVPPALWMLLTILGNLFYFWPDWQATLAPNGYCLAAAAALATAAVTRRTWLRWTATLAPLGIVLLFITVYLSQGAGCGVRAARLRRAGRGRAPGEVAGKGIDAVRELIVKMSMSLDGFASDLDRRNEWMFGGDQQAVDWSVETVGNASLHIMGATSFEAMAAFYPTATIPFAPAMNEIPKAVFSKRGAAILRADGNRFGGNWSDAYVADGDLATETAALKAEPGKPIIAHGGVAFVRSLVAADLVDRFIFLVHPIAVGKGYSIFADLAAPRPLTLTGSIAFPQGAVAQSYRRRSDD